MIMDDLDCPFTDLNAYGSESDKKNPSYIR